MKERERRAKAETGKKAKIEKKGAGAKIGKIKKTKKEGNNLCFDKKVGFVKQN